MGALSVVLAPAGPMDGVLDVLQDCSALGLVEPFVWVRAEEVTRSRVPGLAVTAGCRSATTLAETFTSRQPDRVRICVLVPALAGATPVPAHTEQLLAVHAEATSGGARTERIRCVVSRPGQDDGTEVPLAREGWHNLLLVPEDSRGPGRAHQVLAASSDPVDLGRHAAPTVAGILGLWTGVDAAPLDDVPVLPGRAVRMARSYYRLLDAGDVESRLRERVLTTADGLPRTREHGQPGAHVQNVPLATRTMATALWAKHATVLNGPRIRPSRAAVRPIGPLEALRMFFGFLLTALRSAPTSWYQRVMRGASSVTARVVHDAIFGAEPAAYEVVVRGISGAARPADWDELVDAGTALETALVGSDQEGRHAASAGFPGLWQDYVDGALTLADGGYRDPLLPPVQIGTTTGVLAASADCVPGPSEDFTDVPGYVSAALGTTSVGANDLLAARALEQQLRARQSDSAMASDAGHALQRLDAWQRDRRRSYAWHVGVVLADRLVEVADEVRGLVEGLAAIAHAPDLDAASRARQRRLSRVTTFLFVGLCAVVVGAGVLAWLSVISWGDAGIVAGTALLVWLVASFVVFTHGQRALFRELNRRRTLVAQADAMRVNLVEALRDQRRLATAYRQFVEWSAVLGVLLAEPFGPIRPAESRAPSVGGGMPLSTRLGEAVADDVAIASAAALLRRDVFTAGWLTPVFESAVRDVERRLGPDADALQGSPERIFETPGGPGRTPLTEWARSLREDGAGAAAGDRVWARLLDTLRDGRAELGDSLLAKVRPLDVAGAEPVPLDDFMAGVDRAAGGGAGVERFSPVALAEDASMRLSTVVERDLGTVVRRGLGCVATLTQLGEGVPDYEFVEFSRPVGAGVADGRGPAPSGGDLEQDLEF